MPYTHSRALRACVCAWLIALSTACDDAPKPAKLIDTPRETISRVGDVSIRANVLTTASLSEAMARQYGIERADHRAMLLVSVRRGPEGRDVALPATVEARVSNLQGQSQAIAMRELRTGDYVDYVGIAEVSPPDTLRFELEIVREGGERSKMTFSRDFAQE